MNGEGNGNKWEKASHATAVVRTLLLGIITIIAWALHSEFNRFAAEKLQPLTNQITAEVHKREMDDTSLAYTTKELRREVEELRVEVAALKEAVLQMRLKMEKIYDETVPGRR